jgi:rhodanese-related sulfurtransferase
MPNLFSSITSVSPKDVPHDLPNDTNDFVDVRTSAEYAVGHAKGARNIPLDTLPNHTEELKGYQAVYVICASGGRSAQAASYLLSLGVNAQNVSGGTLAWHAEGLPIVRS